MILAGGWSRDGQAPGAANRRLPCGVGRRVPGASTCGVSNGLLIVRAGGVAGVRCAASSWGCGRATGHEVRMSGCLAGGIARARRRSDGMTYQSPKAKRTIPTDRLFVYAVLGSEGFGGSQLLDILSRSYVLPLALLFRPVVPPAAKQPSGVHVYGSLDEDVRAFCSELGGQVEFRRLAVLPEHVARYRLVTSPAKASDRRAFTGETVQAEALPPDVLANLVRSAIESELDLRVYLEVLEQEREQRATLAAWSASLERLEGER